MFRTLFLFVNDILDELPTLFVSSLFEYMATSSTLKVGPYPYVDILDWAYNTCQGQTSLLNCLKRYCKGKKVSKLNFRTLE